MKIIAIVVTYYPEKILLCNNISAFINYVDKVLIWENTPLSDKFKYRFVSNEKVEYCGDGINSISRGLNYAWNYARSYGYDYVLTMDQDSLWHNFCKFKNDILFNIDISGIWGPNINDEFSSEQSIIEKDSIITSGMLVSVNIINRVGGWNEIFDIDCVDEEFCLKAQKIGIKSYICTKCILTQRFGVPKHVKLFGHVGVLRNDSPSRLYSIYKNHVILIRMYPEVKSIRKDFWTSKLGIIKWIVVFEESRLRKLYAIVSGIICGCFYNISTSK